MLAAALLAAAACGHDAGTPRAAGERWANVLDGRSHPRDANDLAPPGFADLGAWQSFALPGGGASAETGFTGPWLMAPADGRWLSPAIARVRVTDAERGELLWPDSSVRVSERLPASLHRVLAWDGLVLEQRLWFTSSRTAIVWSTLRNVGRAPRKLAVGIDGRVWLRGAALAHEGSDVLVRFGGAGDLYRIRTSAPLTARAEGDAAYALGPAAPTSLAPGDSLSLAIALSLFEHAADTTSERDSIAAAFADPQASLAAQTGRWDAYLARILAAAPAGDAAVRVALVKSVETLIGNWRAARGDLRHDGVFPSLAVRDYHGMWAWDSWKHAAALALFAPRLAEDQVRVMLDHQDSAGMVADVVYRDPREDNWRDTKPPLAAWAVWQIYARTGDRAFVAEVLPALERYHRWWYAHRDHDGDGLCEYGSTDGTLIAAKWESGMDNAARFDSARMRRNGPRAWSLDQESVDLNAYLFAEKGYLAALRRALGDTAAAARYERDAIALGARIRRTMFDARDGFFHDVSAAGHRAIGDEGAEGWIPLWAGVADSAQARRVAAVLADSTRFATPLPFPTLARDSRAFAPVAGYWRGPVWYDQAYFAVAGLDRYGMHDAARTARRALLARGAGIARRGPSLHENYDPLTGDTLNAPQFSWTAAHIILLVAGEAGGR